MEQKTDKKEKITFASYYNSLTTKQKRKIREQLKDVVSESHLYSQLRGENPFKPLLKREIERITKQKFSWE